MGERGRSNAGGRRADEEDEGAGSAVLRLAAARLVLRRIPLSGAKSSPVALAEAEEEGKNDRLSRALLRIVRTSSSVEVDTAVAVLAAVVAWRDSTGKTLDVVLPEALCQGGSRVGGSTESVPERRRLLLARSESGARSEELGAATVAACCTSESVGARVRRRRMLSDGVEAPDRAGAVAETTDVDTVGCARCCS